jgi:hypothetical protein
MAHDIELQDKMQKKIDKVEEDTYLAVTSSDYYQLAADYDEVLQEMEDQNYRENQTVTINNENMTMSDIEAKIIYLNEKADNLKRTEKINKEIQLYEDLLVKNVDVYGNTYTTADQLEDEIEHLDNIYDLMLDTELVNLNNENYTREELKEFTDSQIALQDYLSDDDLVQLEPSDTSEEVSFISEDDFDYRMSISEKVSVIQSLTSIENKNSSQLHDLSEAYSSLLTVMDEEKTVIIDGDEYTFAQIESLANQAEEDAVELEHKEIQDEEILYLNNCYESLGDYACYSELNELQKHWSALVEAMDNDDFVEVNGQNYSYSAAKETAEDIKTLAEDLPVGMLYQVSNEGEFSLVPTPKIIDSSSLSSEDFNDFVEGSSSYKTSDLIITSNSVSEEVLAEGEEILMERNFVSSSFLQISKIFTGFLQIEEENSSETTKGKDFHEGSTEFLIVSTFIEGKSGTGKVFLIDEDNMESKILVEGLEKPTGVCVDVNHNYLYIADQGFNETGKIYQFFVSFNSKKFEVVSNVSYVIYSGTPYDCKVDAYGNLFFTDYYSSTVNKVRYSDLSFSYSDTFSVLFNSPGIYPAGIDLFQDESLIFTSNNGNGSVYRLEVETLASQALVVEANLTWGVGLYKDIAFYSIETPEVKALSLSSLLYESFQSQDLISPKGVCVGQKNVYLADYDAGVLYKGSVESTNSFEMFAYVQAVYSCFAVNRECDSDWAGMILAVLGLYLI